MSGMAIYRQPLKEMNSGVKLGLCVHYFSEFDSLFRSGC